MQKIVLTAVLFCFMASGMAQEPSHSKVHPSGKAIELKKHKKEKKPVATVQQGEKPNAERKLELIPKERCGTR
ncbi:MAG TPA: hypothetical protein VK177_19630 [Flavobacteriales bacterium]|nr:hypothetical protein [Flavobacteriales bacterium]